MASITERSGKFFVRVRRDGFPTLGKTFIKKTDALSWARRTESDMESGRWINPAEAAAEAAVQAAAEAAAAVQAVTMREALAQYRIGHGATLKGADTYAYWFDELARWEMAGKPVDAVTAFDVARWRDEQASRLTPSTVVRKLGLLAGFFTWCVKDQGLVKTNPVHAVRKPRANDARDRTLDAEEQDWLMQAARSSRADWLPDCITVLLRTAMRRGELHGLTISDVDFENSTAHLSDTKNGEARDVPVDTVALAALGRLAVQAGLRGEETLLPVGDPAAISLAFRRTVARAQTAYKASCLARGVIPEPAFLEGFRLHDMRHCAVTAWAATGALSLPELMQVSGHKTPRMLTRYINLKASTLAAKMATLAESIN
jgi:integrase